MKLALPIVLLLTASAAQPQAPRTINVQLKDRGANGFMVFEPGYVQANVGDVIHFIPASAGHDVQSIDGMLPADVSPFAGTMSRPFDLKVSKPGLYGIKCAPHFGMGMVALIKVGSGKAPNAATAGAAKLPPLAAKRMTAFLAAAR